MRSAYTAAIEEAIKHNCRTLGFALLSAGIFRGGRSLDAVLQIGCEAVRDAAASPLKEVYLVGFTPAELGTLMKAAEAAMAGPKAEADPGAEPGAKADSGSTSD